MLIIILSVTNYAKENSENFLWTKQNFFFEMGELLIAVLMYLIFGRRLVKQTNHTFVCTKWEFIILDCR